MRQSIKRVPDSAEKMVRDIRRATRRHHSAEVKMRASDRFGSNRWTAYIMLTAANPMTKA